MKPIIADLYKPKKGEIEVGYYGAVLNLGNEIVELKAKINHIFDIFETVDNSIEETNMKKIENITKAVMNEDEKLNVIWEIESENNKTDFQEIVKRFEMLNKINPNMNIEIIHKGENPIWLTRINGLILSDVNGKIEETKIN